MKPQNIQNDPLIARFMRVKESGLFDINEFCMVTGCSAEYARASLCAEGAYEGRVIALDDDFFLLKPSKSSSTTRVWYDWAFKLDTQMSIWDACSSAQSRQTLMEVTGLNITTLDRYLRAMLRAGILRSIGKSRFSPKKYIQGTWRPLTTYYSEIALYSVKESTCQKLNLIAN